MSLLNALLPSRNRTPATLPAEDSLAHAVKPVFEIKETADAFGVTVYLPGVAKDGLEITAEDSEIRVVGRRGWQRPESWTALYRESAQAPFALTLTHDHAVDADKIAAQLGDGVLRLVLPKVEAAKPRKIAVN